MGHFPGVRGGFRASGAGPGRPSAKIQADGQHTFSFLPGSPTTMEPHQADRSVLDALELWITGLRPCWRGLDVATAAERPELAGAILSGRARPRLLDGTGRRTSAHGRRAFQGLPCA